MKFISTRGAAALALALTLAACGGKAQFTIGGQASNLQYPGLVLATNGQETTVTPAAKPNELSSFSFPQQIEYGEQYLVTVKNQPLHQTCVLNEHTQKNTAGLLAEIHVLVYCTVNSYSVGGTVSGLTADGLVLANGSSAPPAKVAKGAATFVMPAQVAYGVTYGITVVEQPAGLSCSVANPSGTMGDAKVDNIAITCVPAA